MIVILDCATNKTERKALDIPDIDKFQWGCILGKDVWLFPQNGINAVHIDLKNLWSEKIHLGFEINDLVHVAECEDKIYLLMRNTGIYQLDTKHKDVSFVRINVNGEGFCRIVATPKNVVLLPKWENDIEIINFENMQIEKYNNYPQGFKYIGNERESKYMGSCDGDGIRYFAMQSANHILCIDLKSGNIGWIKPRLVSSEEKNRYLYEHDVNSFFEENCSLNCFFKIIKSDYVRSNSISKIGENIWESIK